MRPIHAPAVRSESPARMVLHALSSAREWWREFAREHFEYGEHAHQCERCLDVHDDTATHLCSGSLPPQYIRLEGYCVTCERIRFLRRDGSCRNCGETGTTGLRPVLIERN